MNTFDEIFQFPKLQNSYIFKFESIKLMLEVFDISVQDFKIIAKKLNLIENLYASKKDYKNGNLRMHNGISFSFDIKTSLDILEIESSYDEGSNTIILINGFPMTEEQKENIIQKHNMKTNNYNLFDQNIKYNILKHSTPDDVLKICQTDRKYSKLCSNDAIFARLIQEHYPNFFDKNVTSFKEQYKFYTLDGINIDYFLSLEASNLHHLHLTIADIEKLKPGDILDAVVFDRNFYEYGILNLDNKRPYNPEEFLQSIRIKIKYLGNYEWILYYDWAEVNDIIHINIEEYHSYYHWYPLNDLGEFNMNIKEFPKDTRVGNRGPVMLWKDVKYLPKLYYIMNRVDVDDDVDDEASE